MVDDLARGGAAPALTEELVYLLMSDLAAVRPVFHSEADFQHSFAARLSARRPDLEIRLEIPYRVISSADPALCGVADMHSRKRDRTAATTIEFKYLKREWEGTAFGEHFKLKDQSAQDLGRHEVVHDIHRLEQWQAAAGGSAFAVLLSNDPSFWEPPVRPPTGQDAAFRIHEGAQLVGTRPWKGDANSPLARTLHGDYTMTWRPYSELPGPESRGRTLKYLVIPVHNAPTPAPTVPPHR